MFLVDVIDKGSSVEFSYGALMSLLSIVIVFAVLFIIIGITELVFKFTGLLDLKKEKESKGFKKEVTNEIKNTEIKDEDMMVAVLVASIDYQNEIHKDVKLVSVSEVK